MLWADLPGCASPTHIQARHPPTPIPPPAQTHNAVYAFDLRTGAFQGTVVDLGAPGGPGGERVEQIALSA